MFKYIMLMTLFCSCASTYNNQTTKQKEPKKTTENKEQAEPASSSKKYESTPTREDFVPLAPPVVIEGSPKVNDTNNTK